MSKKTKAEAPVVKIPVAEEKKASKGTVRTDFHSRKQWVYIDGVLDHTVDHTGHVEKVSNK